MSSQEVFDTARLYLPKYLSAEQTKQLFEELKLFPDIPNWYLTGDQYKAELLQGDGWKGFLLRSFEDGAANVVSGIVISNSCDIDEANRRAVPVNIVYAPLVSVTKYEQLLRDNGMTESQIGNVLTDIRKQRVTSIFHLPAVYPMEHESIALLDDLHSHPLDEFSQRERSSLFTLGQTAFYLFLLKLSIHFTRVMEGVPRFDRAA